MSNSLLITGNITLIWPTQLQYLEKVDFVVSRVAACAITNYYYYY